MHVLDTHSQRYPSKASPEMLHGVRSEDWFDEAAGINRKDYGGKRHSRIFSEDRGGPIGIVQP